MAPPARYRGEKRRVICHQILRSSISQASDTSFWQMKIRKGVEALIGRRHLLNAIDRYILSIRQVLFANRKMPIYNAYETEISM